MVQYPMNMFESNSLWWPNGIIDGALIKAGHDIEMFE